MVLTRLRGRVRTWVSGALLQLDVVFGRRPCLWQVPAGAQPLKPVGRQSAGQFLVERQPHDNVGMPRHKTAGIILYNARWTQIESVVLIHM
jgi:hypothetical protein